MAVTFWTRRRKRGRPRTDPRKRFLAKVEKVEGGCWRWRGNFHRQFRLGDRVIGAARAAHELFLGPLPRGLSVEPACGRFDCVRPDHLSKITTGMLRAKSARVDWNFVVQRVRELLSATLDQGPGG